MILTDERIVTAANEKDDIACIRMIQLWQNAFNASVSAAATPSPESLFAGHRVVPVALNYMRAIHTDPTEAAILQPCSILGRVEERLTDLQFRIINGLLEAHWAEYESGRTPMPSRSSIYSTSQKPLTIPAAKLDLTKLTMLFAVAEHIHYHPEGVTSDLFCHLTSSATAAGIQVETFATDQIMPARINFDADPTHQRAATNLAKLADKITTKKPDIIIAEGNYIQGSHYLNAAFWAEQKRRHPFKLAIYIGDADETRSEIITPWADVADLIIGFHGPAKPFFDNQNFVCVPCVPFDERLIRHDSKKTTPFFYSGTNTRNRQTWLQALVAAQMQIEARLHQRFEGSLALPTAAYYDGLAQAKMTFNNGWIDAIASITTGRTFEAILAKTLVLEQSGAPTFEYFIPFVHYVPVQNVSQLILFARFFELHDHWRSKITDSAHRFFVDHYHSRLHWHYLANALLSRR